jgi:hypothetical protein
VIFVGDARLLCNEVPFICVLKKKKRKRKEKEQKKKKRMSFRDWGLDAIS